jgi:hypothetical protein
MHSYIIYFQDRSVYFAAAKYVERSWEDINRSKHMNVEIGTEAAQFPEKENIIAIFVAVQCTLNHQTTCSELILLCKARGFETSATHELYAHRPWRPRVR